jgi:hypothetical protein
MLQDIHEQNSVEVILKQSYVEMSEMTSEFSGTYEYNITVTGMKANRVEERREKLNR